MRVWSSGVKTGGEAVPIRPENRDRYPKDWWAISARIRERAGQRCEQCGVGNGMYVRRANGRFVRIVLTVAHLNHTPEDCRDENLKALCQKCHNSYDAPMRARGIKERIRAKRAVGDLFRS